jgi:uncharacterized membrane protein YidH (DUF202 family)
LQLLRTLAWVCAMHSPRSRRPPQRHVFAQQRLHILDQGLHIGPDLQRRLQHLARQRVALLAPVILCSLGLTLAFIGLQRFIKQIAAVERMLAQHALAPGVYGVDGGIVHALRSHVQPPGSCVALLAFGIGIAQVAQSCRAPPVRPRRESIARPRSGGHGCGPTARAWRPA